MSRRLCAALGLLLAVAACGAPEALPKEKIVLAMPDGEGVVLDVEVAGTAAARRQGLMGRTTLCDTCGMLFAWPRPMPVAMWMKNTPLPLDMAFIVGGRVVGVAENTVPYDETPLPAPVDVDMVLEVRGGSFARWGVGEGATVRLPREPF